MIVVFDTSNWIPALIFGGVPAQAIIHAQAVDQMLTCTQLEDEVVRIMGAKFNDSPAKHQRRMAEILKDAARIVVTGNISNVCRDPKDDFIVECAVTGRANCIVTGDKDLLSLDPYGAIRILTPRQYLDIQKHPPHRSEFVLPHQRQP